jgi:seryl-tRNA synthetase
LVSVSGRVKELVSVSNCTDYQTRELEVRYGTPIKEDKGKEEGKERKQYVHALIAVSLTCSKLRMNEKGKELTHWEL